MSLLLTRVQLIVLLPLVFFFLTNVSQFMKINLYPQIVTVTEFVKFIKCRSLAICNVLRHTNKTKSPFPNYASVPAKSRLRAKFSYICSIFSLEASTSGYCLQELKRNSEMGFWFYWYDVKCYILPKNRTL